MSMKRIAGAAALVAGLGISALNPGFASSAPLDPPPPCPNCHGGGGGAPRPTMLNWALPAGPPTSALAVTRSRRGT